MSRVYWQGTFFATTSLAIVNRRLVRALIERRNVDIAIGTDPFAMKHLPPQYRTFTEHMRFGADDSDVTVSHQWPPRFAAPESSRYVHYQPWEYGSMPSAWFDALIDDCQDVWVPTSFNRQSYVDAGFDAARVAVIPHGVDRSIFFPSTAARGRARFCFLFVGGTIFRKGIDLLIDSYIRAFRGRHDVVLKIKDVNVRNAYRGQNAADQIRPLTANPDLPDIEYLDEDVGDAALADLMRTADALVHPYRGEAFAMPVLEAMACGVPAIVTGGGATDDYVDETVGWRIPSTHRSLTSAEVPFPTKTSPWLLEPDANALVHLMRNAYENRDEVLNRGKAAAARAAEWTWDRAAQIVESRLADVMQRSPVAEHRHERYADAQLFAERISSRGELDGIIIELFKRLGIAEPSFVEFGGTVLGQSPAAFVETGLGWQRIPEDGRSGTDLAVFTANPTPAQISAITASGPRAVTCPGSTRTEFATYTCIAVDRSAGDALLVRNDLLGKTGFRGLTLTTR